MKQKADKGFIVKSKKFSFRLVILAMIFLFLLTGCSNNPTDSSSGSSKVPDSSKVGDDVVELTFMHYYTKEEADAGDAARIIPRETLQEYIDEHPEIKIKSTEFQHNDYETKMQALAAANDLPDVFLAKGSWTENYVENGQIMDITAEYNACEWKDLYRNPEVLFKPVTYKEKIYGTPIQYSSTSIAFYNIDLWKEAGYDSFPTTWDKLFEAVQKFNDKNITTIAFGNKDKWNYNSSWISTIGDRFTGFEWTDSIINKDGKAKFTDQSFIDSLALTKKIGASGALNVDYASINNQQATMQFLQGKAATFIDGYWAIEYMNANMDDGFSEKIGIAPLPGVEGGKGDQSSITAGCGWFLAVNGKLEGKKKEAAISFILQQTGPALSNRYANIGQIGPSETTETPSKDIPLLNQKYLEFIDKSSSSVEIYDALINGSVIAVMNDEFPELLSGSTTPEAAAEAIQKEYESIMK